MRLRFLVSERAVVSLVALLRVALGLKLQMHEDEVEHLHPSLVSALQRPMEWAKACSDRTGVWEPSAGQNEKRHSCWVFMDWVFPKVKHIFCVLSAAPCCIGFRVSLVCSLAVGTIPWQSSVAGRTLVLVGLLGQLFVLVGPPPLEGKLC